jgi:tyrosyl-tRNA synthetase
MMNFEELKVEPVSASAQIAVEETASAGVPLVGTPSHVATPKTFSAEIIVKGRYENIKNFFQRVAHMNRTHRTRDFLIKTPEMEKLLKLSTTNPKDLKMRLAKEIVVIFHGEKKAVKAQQNWENIFQKNKIYFFENIKFCVRIES